MSRWTDALTDARIEKAKKLYAQLQAIGWANLSVHDRQIMQVLGYLTLEDDDIDLACLCDADIEAHFPANKASGEPSCS